MRNEGGWGPSRQPSGPATLTEAQLAANRRDFGTEILAHPKLMFDIGKMAGLKPGQFDAGVGYEYWYNKFGNESKYLVGSQQSAFFVEAGYHF